MKTQRPITKTEEKTTESKAKSEKQIAYPENKYHITYPDLVADSIEEFIEMMNNSVVEEE